MNAPMKINGHYVFQRPNPRGKFTHLYFCILYAYGMNPYFYGRGRDA